MRGLSPGLPEPDDVAGDDSTGLRAQPGNDFCDLVGISDMVVIEVLRNEVTNFIGDPSGLGHRRCVS